MRSDGGVGMSEWTKDRRLRLVMLAKEGRWSGEQIADIMHTSRGQMYKQLRLLGIRLRDLKPLRRTKRVRG